jgi:hypothetical protein
VLLRGQLHLPRADLHPGLNQDREAAAITGHQGLLNHRAENNTFDPISHPL